METLVKTHTQTYPVTGMTCEGCEYKVQHLFKEILGVVSAKADRAKNEVVVEMETHIAAEKFEEALSPYPKYQFGGKPVVSAIQKDLFWQEKAIWIKAGKNTLNCLIGCSIGDFAMMTYLQTYQHYTVSMPAMMILSMIAGLVTSILLETALLKIKEDFFWLQALKTAFSMSFLSMLAMELAENITDLALTGGKVSVNQPFYWVALSISLISGFLVPLPYNYYKLKKYGKSCH